jgi:hypothetical protein
MAGYIWTYEEIKDKFTEVEKEQFYNVIGTKNVQLDVYFCKTDEVYCYTRFALKFPFDTIGIEVSKYKMRDGKHIKEYYIKKNIYEKD